MTLVLIGTGLAALIAGVSGIVLARHQNRPARAASVVLAGVAAPLLMLGAIVGEPSSVSDVLGIALLLAGLLGLIAFSSLPLLDRGSASTPSVVAGGTAIAVAVAFSIWLIVATALGERVMRPRFGAGVADYVMQPNSAVTRTNLASAIRQALVRWEPRIELETVRVDPVDGEPSQVTVAIDYRIRQTNELFNLVYPLYLEEGVS